MKSRSHHRLPIVSDPPDDWGDGSWTVDCVCGVTFDDGEEMVKCDECGVWVHTRCSRYVKGEKLFACDKCKAKKGRGGDSSKETEVAQLLVELPMKTMRMDGRTAPVQLPPPSAPPRALYKRLWTDIPMEERVHVQGVPGGDPALFQGVSPIFSPQLWKCTGYVPKKFNFQYKEFPCWEDEAKDVEKQNVNNTARDDEEKENMVDRGADVLVSLSKEIIPHSPQVGAVGGLGGHDERGGCERKLPPKEMKKRDWGKGGLSSGRIQTSVKRDRNRLRPVSVPLAKRKLEELGASKERSGKKKPRNLEVDNKKRGSSPASDAHKLDIIECGDSKVTNSSDFRDAKNEDRRETLLTNHVGNLEGPTNGNEPKSMLFAKASTEVFCDGTHKHNLSPDTVVKVENINHQSLTSNGISSSADASEASFTEINGIGKVSMKEEDAKTAVDGLNHLRDESHNMEDLNGDSSSVAVDSEKSKLPDGDQRSITQDMLDVRTLPDSNSAVSLNSAQTNSYSKIEADDVNTTEDSELHSASDVKPSLVGNSSQHFRRSDEMIADNVQVHDVPVGNLECGEQSSQGAERVSEAVNSQNTVTGEPVSMDEPNQCEQESAGLLTSQEGCFKSRQAAKHAEEPLKLEATSPNPPAPSLRRLVVGIGKSVSSTVVLSKASVPGSLKSVGTLSSPAPIKSTHFSKQRVKVKSSTDRRKDGVATNMPRDESKREVPAPVKNRPMSPANYGLKQAHTSRTNSSASKHSMPEAEDQQVLCPSKASTIQNVANFSGTADCSSMSQTQITSQSKPAASTIQKSEKINQSSSQLSSKVSNQSSVHPPTPVNASATLSDEELALLLHQELNSSPRVPRVPRMRHTGSLPQLSSPSATSLLAKRTSSSGGKDHISVSRRKNKEEPGKDNSRNPRELTDETKRANRFSTSPDQKRQDSAFATDGLTSLTKKDACNRSPEVIASNKRNTTLVSSALSNSGHSSSMEANDQTLSSIRSSPRDVSDDDVGGAAGSTHTLPGLIDEIMSKGKRMTYEELCNAVLPHWHNLRKHNGERYAYSSHSQAVLDCLRNRNEWAQLIDRGPKTNSSRKRRRSDVETSVVDSESEDVKGRPSKQIGGKTARSHREEFPKGKRKARKRRRLQLQGRVLKEVRKRQKADTTTDDDFGAYSSESSESIFSEDESMGGRSGEAFSSSSDETGGM